MAATVTTFGPEGGRDLDPKTTRNQSYAGAKFHVEHPDGRTEDWEVSIRADGRIHVLNTTGDGDGILIWRYGPHDPDWDGEVSP